MKEFIYLDTDYLTSALAQINKGNILSYTSDITDSSQESNTSTAEDTNRTEIGLKALINFAANSKHSSSQQDSLSNISSAREILTKSFDDYSFNIFYEYIKEHNNISVSNWTSGDFIDVSGEFKLVDFDFLLTLLGDDFIELYTSGEAKQSEYKTRKEIDAYQKIRKSFYVNTRKNIMRFQKLLPSSTILQMQNVLAPIKTQFLRGDFKDISLKYDTIHLIARITRKYIHKTYECTDLLLHAVEYQLPNILNTINIKIDDNSYIATPIAIYIE